MKWLQIERSPEESLRIELEARSMTERACAMQQQLLQQATYEIMRLELLVEDLQAQIASPHP
jgi:hypothetical protein